MRPRIKWGWVWAILLGIALLALIGWRMANRSQTAAAAGGGQGGAGAGGGARGGAAGGGGAGRMAPSIEVATAKSAKLISTLNAVGNVESPQRVVISPRVSGRIEFLQAREGDLVKAGQVLARLDPSDLNAAVVQQQAAVAQARSRLAEAQLGASSTGVSVASQIAQQQASVASSRADFNQVQQNLGAQIASAQAGVTDAEARLRAAQTGVQNAQAGVSREQANLQNAQQRLARAETLFSQGAIPAQQRDDARTAVEVQQQAVKVAEGQVDAARASVESAQATLRTAQNNLSITQRRSSADVAAARARVTQAQAGLNVAQANRSQNPAYQQNLAALRASVQAAEAQLQAARVRLQDTTILSPINGSVTARGANPGEMATASTAILTVESLDWVYVTTSIPLESVSAIREGMTAQVTTDALPGRTFTGPISNVNPSADPQSRQFGVRIRLANRGHVLKPGMYARVAIVTSQVNAAVAVPAEAVKRARDGVTVTVVGKDGTAEVRPVTTGATSGKLVELLSGVRAGEQVVTLSYAPIRDGQKVTLPGQGGGGSGRGQGRGQSGQGSGGGRRQS